MSATNANYNQKPDYEHIPKCNHGRNRDRDHTHKSNPNQNTTHRHHMSPQQELDQPGLNKLLVENSRYLNTLVSEMSKIQNKHSSIFDRLIPRVNGLETRIKQISEQLGAIVSSNVLIEDEFQERINHTLGAVEKLTAAVAKLGKSQKLIRPYVDNKISKVMLNLTRKRQNHNEGLNLRTRGLNNSCVPTPPSTVLAAPSNYPRQYTIVERIVGSIREQYCNLVDHPLTTLGNFMYMFMLSLAYVLLFMVVAANGAFICLVLYPSLIK